MIAVEDDMVREIREAEAENGTMMPFEIMNWFGIDRDSANEIINRLNNKP